jgi:hypothetical protein
VFSIKKKLKVGSEKFSISRVEGLKTKPRATRKSKLK